MTEKHKLRKNIDLIADTMFMISIVLLIPSAIFGILHGVGVTYGFGDAEPYASFKQGALISLVTSFTLWMQASIYKIWIYEIKNDRET